MPSKCCRPGLPTSADHVLPPSRSAPWITTLGRRSRTVARTWARRAWLVIVVELRGRSGWLVWTLLVSYFAGLEGSAGRPGESQLWALWPASLIGAGSEWKIEKYPPTRTPLWKVFVINAQKRPHKRRPKTVSWDQRVWDVLVGTVEMWKCGIGCVVPVLGLEWGPLGRSQDCAPHRCQAAGAQGSSAAGQCVGANSAPEISCTFWRLPGILASHHQLSWVAHLQGHWARHSAGSCFVADPVPARAQQRVRRLVSTPTGSLATVSSMTDDCLVLLCRCSNMGLADLTIFGGTGRALSPSSSPNLTSTPAPDTQLRTCPAQGL